MNNRVAELIAANLGELPHPDGSTSASVLGRTATLPAEQAEVVTRAATRFSESIVHLVETEGWTFVPNDELERLKAKEAPAPKVAVLKCNTCNTELLQVNLTNPDRVATNGATFLNGLAKLSPECPHGVKP